MPSADLAERILAAAEVSTPSAWGVYSVDQPRSIWPVVVSVASVCAAAIFGLAVLIPMIKGPEPHDGPRANPPPIASRPSDDDLHAVSGTSRSPGERAGLNRALADATSATWELARSASEPAARIGRDVLDATTRAEDVVSEPEPEAPTSVADRLVTATGALTLPVPSLAPFAPDPSAALQQVGDHLASGVRPLSDTARHAFGFLIGPAPDRAAPRNTPQSSKGA